MLFKYRATTNTGEAREGKIDAPTLDVAIASLQRRGMIVVSVDPLDERNFLEKLSVRRGVPQKDVVLLSRQLATLFEAKVSALNSFQMLSSETGNAVLRQKLSEISDDIQGGLPISSALSKHSSVFSPFYVSMVRAGEESGKLSETFVYLADYMERSYELVSKARNALLYPAFVIFSFVVVMVLMLTVIIPKLEGILLETGAELPWYTNVVLGLSSFALHYGLFVLIILAVAGAALWKWGSGGKGREAFSRAKLAVPYVGSLYQRIYLSRIADNLDTMLVSGIAVVRALEITADVVGSQVYRDVLKVAAEDIKGGSAIAEAFSKHPEIPNIMVQMMKVGEETGKLGFVLNTIARFYRREVDSAVETLVSLIEPIMIILLGLGVGFLLLAVLGPIYNISAGIS